MRSKKFSYLYVDDLQKPIAKIYIQKNLIEKLDRQKIGFDKKISYIYLKKVFSNDF